MKRKGQSMSINVIIVAALALLVLVLLALIFTGKITLFKQKSDLCDNFGGVCKTACDTTAGETKTSNYACANKNDVCCLLVKG